MFGIFDRVHEYVYNTRYIYFLIRLEGVSSLRRKTLGARARARNLWSRFYPRGA